MTDSRIDTYEHRHKVQVNLMQIIDDLQDRLLEHDYSKLLEPEKSAFDKAIALKTVEYGTPEYEEAKASLGDALLHHYAGYPHHPEFYAILRRRSEDYSPPTYELIPETVANGEAFKQMSLIDIIEMLADWKAATERMKDGDILKSIDINQERFGYSDEMRQILINTVYMLGWHQN